MNGGCDDDQDNEDGDDLSTAYSDSQAGDRQCITNLLAYCGYWKSFVAILWICFKVKQTFF